MPKGRSDDDQEKTSANAESIEKVQASPNTAGRQRPDLRKLRPSEFMRSRRPHLFSDTKIIEHAHLDRAVFDHHLDTLTNRKQELAFERFARKLAEKEICPNLVPQTGPTGGGDSKVDTETYLVSEEIAARWYEGQPKEAAQQRWAFAISTKKAWKPKLKADVVSIAGTQRGYVRAYFITSRYVKDKDRGDTQDELRKLHGFDVEILDRTWIIEKVFANRREQLVFDTLDLERPLVPIVTKGPLDTSRETELDELEQQINDATRYQGIEYQLVEDCLETALLARGLERPRIEVDGRFDRAIGLAEQHGTSQQQLRIAYNRAWTLFWWYEDYASFMKAYDHVEHLAKGSLQATDIGLLKNLWQLLHTAVNNNDLDGVAVRFAERTAIVKQELQRLQHDKNRPTTALQARAQYLLIDLVEANGNNDQLKAVLTEFQTIFVESKGLVNFPARDLIDLVMELGEVFPFNNAFDKIFEDVLTVAQERDSSATAGRMLLRRGMQKLDHDQPYEAIRLLGRAQQHLTLRECNDELVTTLALCAQAYEAAGLLWAARASMLLATSQALMEFSEEGTVTRQAFACLRRLTWLELQLGRVSCVLAWVESTVLFSHTIKLNTQEREALHSEWMHVDLTLGLLLLKTEFFDLKHVTNLAAALGQFRLDFSWIALLYILGHEDWLRAEKVFPENETSEDVLGVFTDAVNTIEPTDLPGAPEFLDKRKIELRSSVLGCGIIAELPNQNRSLFLAEAILSALEAFLATSLQTNLLPYAPNLRVKIIPTDFMAKPLEWTILEDQALIEIRHSTDESIDVPALRELLPDLIIRITMQLAMPIDLAHVETLFRDEQAMGRAMNLTHVAISVGNILGNNPKLRLTDWVSSNTEAFRVRRAQPWNEGHTSFQKQLRKPPPVPGTGDPPTELLDTEKLKHRDFKVVSLINIPLWNQARWKAVGFAEYPGVCEPPFLVLVFDDKNAGSKIFAAWRNEIGRDDKAGKLRITVITGIDRKNPAHYRVIIGPNLDWDALPRSSRIVGVSRINTMTPSSSTNLDRFLNKYRGDGIFFLVPGHIEPGDTVPSFDQQLAISSSQINVRPAWEIGEHDPDVIGIDENDDVIIPPDIEAPPVLRTLERIKKRRQHDTLTEQLMSRAEPRTKVGRNDPCPCGSGKKFKKCCGR
jgi:hypothetical protein